MKTKSMLCALVMFGCGGAENEPREPVVATTPQTSASRDLSQVEPPAPQLIEQAEPTGAPMAGEGATPAAAPFEATRPSASAELRSIPGDEPIGTLRFERQEDNQIAISGDFTGLKKKGEHALYIHEKGDCGNKGKNAGPHFNPTNAKHGPPSSAQRHAGDFGNVAIDAGGTGMFAMTTDSVTLESEGADSIVGRAVILHARKDNKKGDAGPAIACGVIKLDE
jgi:superoxide dismutase, Cu-Zn family